MKRLLAVMLLACTLFTLCACPGGDPTVPPTPGPGGNDNKCPTCGNDPCTCPPEGNKCPTCGQDPCVCPPPTVEPVYAQTYPYTDEDGVVHIRYQDTYSFGKDIKGIEVVEITSTVTGTTEKDPNLLVKQKDGQSVYADGCGKAIVSFRAGPTVTIQVDPSPINMLFVTGQSNASGDPQSGLKDGFYEHYSNDYIRVPETMAYLTWTGQQVSVDVEQDKKDYAEAYNSKYGSLWPSTTPEKITFVPYMNYITPTLDWETASVVSGPVPQQFSIPKGQTTFSLCGWNAALAYEWVKQTGERVWIVNCSQGGMEIQQFQPNASGTGTNEYYQAVAVFNAALETLYKEVDAGHFVLNHMAYYWFHGESNSNDDDAYDSEGNLKEYYGGNRFLVAGGKGRRYLTAEEYAAYFKTMHEGFMADVKYSHNGVEKELEYCGIMTIRTKYGERQNTLDQLKLLGPRNAEYYVGATGEGSLKNVFVVSNVTERWVGSVHNGETNPEADAAVEAYMLEVYGTAKRFKEIFGYDMPTTVYEMHPGVHYLMHGHNEMGMDCARNSLRIIRLLTPENCYKLPTNDPLYKMEEDVTIKLVAEDGMTELMQGDIITFDKNTLQAVICPQFVNLYQQVKGVRIEITGGQFTFNANVFTADSRGESFLQFKLFVGNELYDEYAFSVEFR